jgi:hypothetical protein
VGERVGIGIKLRRDCRVKALVGPQDGGEGAELDPAHEQFRRAGDHGNRLAAEVEGEGVVAARIAVDEAEAGDAAGQHADDRRLDAVILAPVLDLVAKPEQGRRTGALGEAGTVEEDDVVAAAGFLDGLARDARPLDRIEIVPGARVGVGVELAGERQRFAEVVHPAGRTCLVDHLGLDDRLDPGASIGVAKVDKRRRWRGLPCRGCRGLPRGRGRD